MGKASRRRRQSRDERGASRRSQSAAKSWEDDPKARAEAALFRLVRSNPPGKVSLAGAYVLGYSALGLAQQEGDEPAWYQDLDPLETLFLGAVWPLRFRDSYEFANGCAAWLRLIQDTTHWQGIERFVREALAASEEHDLPVDAGELMFLLAGRLEAVGLDQQKIPANLLPEKILQGARLAYGPAEDFPLPVPPPDAADQVARLWTATEIGLPHDGTAVDALREGLHMFATAGLDVRGDAIVLLPALYAALVAAEYEDLSEAGERAQAWALGLSSASPLVPVTDVLMIALQRGLDVDTTLGHLFGIEAFTQQVNADDRHWHSSPGEALTTVAFELGYQHVIKRVGKVVRIGKTSAAAIEAQRRRFEKKFGRPPGPEDPLFFDPDADKPQPFSLPGLEVSTVTMLEAAGICPAWIYAYQHTDGLLPRFDGSFATDHDQAEWNEEVDRYMALHNPGGRVDHQAETRKLQNILIGTSLGMVAEDPEHGESVVARLTAGPAPDDGEAALLHEYLRAWAGDLTERLRSDRTVLETACEYARAWGGAALAGQVYHLGQARAEHVAPDAALLAAAAAVAQEASDPG